MQLPGKHGAPPLQPRLNLVGTQLDWLTTIDREYFEDALGGAFHACGRLA
jgi:hypothetical protein